MRSLPYNDIMIVTNLVNKTLALLFPLFGFLLPLQTRWIVRDAPVGDSVWEYGRVSVYGFDLVLLLIAVIVLFLLSGSRIKSRMTMGRLAWTMGAAVFVVYELFVSLEPGLTGVVLVRVLLIAVAGAYLLKQDSIVLRRTLSAFVVSMTLSAGFGAAQFFTQSSMISTKWLGLSWQEASTLGASVVEAQGGRWLRAHGTMPHPNALGGFSSVALVIFFALIVTSSIVGDAYVRPATRAAHVRPLQDVWIFCRNIFIVIAPIILLAGIVTAASRAAIIATVAGGMAIAWQARRDIRFRGLIPWMKGMAVAGLLILLLAGPVAFTRLTARGRLEALSFTKRAAAFEEAAETLRHYGVTGTGLGASTAALRTLYPDVSIWNIQPVHNVSALLLVELGVGGVLILMVGLFMRVKVQSSKFKIQNKSKIQNPNYRNVLPLFICWAVLIMLDHYFWTLPAGLYASGLVWWAGRGLDMCAAYD